MTDGGKDLSELVAEALAAKERAEAELKAERSEHANTAMLASSEYHRLTVALADAREECAKVAEDEHLVGIPRNLTWTRAELNGLVRTSVKNIARRIRALALPTTEPAKAEEPLSETLPAEHKWLDPECGLSGCQSLVWKSRYESAVKGRADFRNAFRKERETNKMALPTTEPAKAEQDKAVIAGVIETECFVDREHAETVAAIIADELGWFTTEPAKAEEQR